MVMARNTKLKPTARKLRQRMTPAEKILWALLRDGQLGVKFRRQTPFVFGVYKYIVDFYCPKYKLIIEIDGGIHNDNEIKEIDEFREKVFIEAGYGVIRFKNEEVINNTKQVLDKIRKEINKLTN
jgi:cyclase